MALYSSAIHLSPAGSETHPQYVQPPVIPGHEFIGEVVKLGPGKSLDEATPIATPTQYTL